jgi:hypothetical protein
VSAAPGLILVTGGITLANEALGAKYTPGSTDIVGAVNWRVIPATAIACLIFSGIAKLNPQIATGLAGITLVTTLFVRVGNGPAPAEHLAQILGYN